MWWRQNLGDSNESKFHLLSFFPWTSSLFGSPLCEPRLFRKIENPLLLLCDPAAVTLNTTNHKRALRCNSELKDQLLHLNKTLNLSMITTTTSCCDSDAIKQTWSQTNYPSLTQPYPASLLYLKHEHLYCKGSNINESVYSLQSSSYFSNLEGIMLDKNNS